MQLTQDDLIARLNELEARIADLRVEYEHDAFVVEEVIHLGEEIAVQAGDRAGWVEDQLTLILAKHGLIEEGPAVDEDEWEA